jgi:uncharacterized protein (TIGR02246 family)
MMRAFALMLVLLSAGAAHALSDDGVHRPRVLRRADADTPLTQAETEVRKLERAWLDAYENHDAEAMDRIVAEDFMITFPGGGVQTKPELMQQIRTPHSKDAKHQRFVTENVQSRSYGETVILTGVVVTLYEKEGKPALAESRYMDTYDRIGGNWKVVASHLSNVPKPAESAEPK